MKLFVFASATAGAVCLSFGAQAETVDCRSIADNGKRLMCYDTLNADTHGSVSKASPEINPKAVTIAAAKSTQAKTPAPNLSGFYFGATFAFGSSTEATIIRPEQRYHTYYGADDVFKANSPTIGVTAGYNAFSGASLFGIQIDVEGDLRAKKWSYDDFVNETSLPHKRSWSSGWEHGQLVGSTMTHEEDGGRIHSESVQRYKYKEQISPTLSARVGHQFDNILLYGRFGAGLTRIKETRTYDDTRSTYCSTSTIESRYPTSISAEEWMIACNNPYNGGSYSSTRTITRPTATIAIGAEYHFDRYFTRLEGEMKHIFLDRKLNFSTNTGLTQYKIVTGIGLRF